MTAARRDPLRWYPPAWRARYGDELRALIEDQCGPDGPGVRERVSLARNGIVERARASSLCGHGAPDESRWRAGALVVVVAWALFMVGGAAFAKAAEHFASAVPTGSRTLPRVAFDAVAVGAVVGGAIVLLGAALAIPAFVRLLRDGGWPALRAHVVRASMVTIVLVALTVPLVRWAHTLSAHQRNGGEPGYAVAFLAWVALVVACLAAWTVVAVVVGHRVVLSRRVVQTEAVLAVVVALVMVAVTVAAATWWAAMAASAPWFLAGTARGTAGSAFDLPLAVAMAVMTAGLATAAAGTARIARWRRPSHVPPAHRG